MFNRLKHLLLYRSEVHAHDAPLELNIASKSCSTLDVFNMVNDLKHYAWRSWVLLGETFAPSKNPSRTLYTCHHGAFEPFSKAAPQMDSKALQPTQNEEIQCSACCAEAQENWVRNLNEEVIGGRQKIILLSFLYVCLFLFFLPFLLSWTYVGLKQWKRSCFKPVTLHLCLISPRSFIHSFSTYILLDKTRDSPAYKTLQESCMSIPSILFAVIMTSYVCSRGAHPVRRRHIN